MTLTMLTGSKAPHKTKTKKNKQTKKKKKKKQQKKQTKKKQKKKTEHVMSCDLSTVPFRPTYSVTVSNKD